MNKHITALVAGLSFLENVSVNEDLCSNNYLVVTGNYKNNPVTLKIFTQSKLYECFSFVGITTKDRLDIERWVHSIKKDGN